MIVKWKLLFVGALMLSGCVTVFGPASYIDNPKEFFRWAATDSDVRVIVVGNPTDAADADLAKAVTGAFQKNFGFLGGKFTTRPGANVRDPYKVIAVFNPPVPITPDRVCRDGEKLSGGANDAFLRMQFVFCGNRALSEISARVPATRDIDDPALRETLDRLALYLAPEKLKENEVTQN